MTTTAGQLRYEHTGGQTIVMGDVTGNGVADFEIALAGIHVLSTADVLL